MVGIVGVGWFHIRAVIDLVFGRDDIDIFRPDQVNYANYKLVEGLDVDLRWQDERLVNGCRLRIKVAQDDGNSGSTGCHFGGDLLLEKMRMLTGSGFVAS